MPNLQDPWKPEAKIKALVYGKFKVGKTFGVGSFPRPNILSFDRGTSVFRNPEWVKRYGQPWIQWEEFYERNTTGGGVVKSHNAFDDACRYFDQWMKPGKRDQFETWVVDSGTTLARAAMNKGIVLLGDKAFAGARSMSQTHQKALEHGLVFPKIQDYGSERSMVEQFIQMLLDTDKHFIFICHEKEFTNDSGNVTEIVPLLTGQGVEAICLKFDEVWNLQAKKVGMTVQRRLTTQPDGIRRAGSRWGLPNDTEWDYSAITAALAAQHEASLKLLEKK